MIWGDDWCLLLSVFVSHVISGESLARFSVLLGGDGSSSSQLGRISARSDID